MDLNQAQTFLAIIETGNFKAAGERLNITQSAVSVRIKTLETVLGRRLFERTKAGATPTSAGQQLERHALAMVRMWRHAQLEMAMTVDESRHVAIGGQPSLWDGFLLKWIAQLRRRHPDMAMTTCMATSKALSDRVLEGTLELAVCYRAEARPGIVVEHLFDEELVLVSSPGHIRNEGGEGGEGSGGGLEICVASERADLDAGPIDYVFVNWGPEFAADHAETYPGRMKSSLNLDLGAIGINYLLDNPAMGHFPIRIAKPYLVKGQLQLVARAPRFVYPVFLLTSEDRRTEGCEDLIESLVAFAESRSDSQGATPALASRRARR